MRDFFLMMFVQLVSYTNLTVNFRAIAHKQYLVACVTAMLASLLAYTIIRKVSRDDTRWGMAGMIIGGGLADMLGIWLTREWQ